MRRLSDPQAAVLSTVAEHEQAGRELFWRPTRSFRSRAGLALEHVDRVANVSTWDLFTVAAVKTRSVQACVTHGWVDATHELVLASGLRDPGLVWSSRAPEPEILLQLRLTEDGQIALGVWRERKLAAPPTPNPVLAGSDRDVVELATRAAALGYRLAPRDEVARRQARRLTRAGWVQRGCLGAGTRTLIPTALGQVEVDPQSADQPEALR